MWEQAAGQIEAIHSMMESGQRSVTMERHTLYLWGVTTALLIIVVNLLFIPQRFPLLWLRAGLSTLFISSILTLVGFWDLRLTRRSRERRDESLSFTQVQLTKVWWGIVAIIVLLNLGMHFFGGGYMFYPILIALVGFAFYIHGLFSQQLLSWVGMLMVLIGLGCIVLHFSITSMEWLTAVIFGIGFPLLAWLLYWRPTWLKRNYRALFSCVWLAAISVPTYAMVQVTQIQASPKLPLLTLQQYQTQFKTQHSAQIVRLPAGTKIPLQIHLHSRVLVSNTEGRIVLQLNKPLDLVLRDGKLTGQYRVGKGSWSGKRMPISIRNVRIQSQLTPARGARVEVNLDLITNH